MQDFSHDTDLSHIFNNSCQLLAIYVNIFFIQNRFLNQTDNYAFVLRELDRAGLVDRIQRTESIENK